MDGEGTTHLSVNDAYRFGAEHGLQSQVIEIREMEIEWDRSYTTTVRRGYIADLFLSKGLLSAYMEKHWKNGKTTTGQSLLRHYLKVKAEYDDFLAGRMPQEREEVDLAEENQRFAAESDLRDFVSQNLSCVEPGLRLFERNGQSGVEFPLEGGRIDILAVDKEGRFLVLEFKLSRGRSSALGQLIYYMAWVDKNLGNGPCRGIVVAKDITDELVLATQRTPGVSLYRYTLSVSLERVT